MKLAAIVTASVLVFAPVADAKCAMQHLAAEVLPDATNGAIVVVASAGYDDASSDDTSKWTLHADGKTVAPVITVLAPGLSVYRLPKGVTAGELTDGTATLARIAATPKKPLSAPAVTAVRHSRANEMERKRSSRTTVTLKGDVPADAVAIVITDAKGTPLSFGRVTPGEALAPYYHGRCSVLPDGTVEPTVGQTVRVFWVDRYGQPSAKSPAIRVVKAP